MQVTRVRVQRRRLVAQRFNHVRMAVPHRDHVIVTIEIFSAVGVPQRRARAAHQVQRLVVKILVCWPQRLAAARDQFLVEADGHAFRGTDAARRRAMRLEVFLVFDLHFVEFRIAAIGIVVKHDQGADLGVGGQSPDLGNQAVPPAVLVRHVVLGVLRIVNQDVDAVQVVDPLVVISSSLSVT
jgi:hypothetical protein